MKSLTARSLTLALAALLWGGGLARADNIPWSYTLDFQPANQTLTSGDANVNIALAGNGDFSKGNTVAVGAFSALLGTTPSVPFNNVPFTLIFDLKDTASSADHAFLFPGTVNGTLTGGGNALTATFSNPSLKFKVGNNDYTVTLVPTSTVITTGGSVTPSVQGPTIINATVTAAPDLGGTTGGGTTGRGTTGGNTRGGNTGGPQQAPEPR